MLRKIASILFLLTSLVIGLGAFGHDSNMAKVAAEFAKFPAFDVHMMKVITIVWRFCSGCMLTFGLILVWTWWRIYKGARDVFVVPYAIGLLYLASGALSVLYSGIAFFWLFVVLGTLLIATSWALATGGSSQSKP